LSNFRHRQSYHCTEDPAEIGALQAADEIEYLRWKAERGIKTRHMAAAFRHDPWFVARNVARMAAHTYRGSTTRTMLGLEDERQAFMRYKEIRGQERHYL
jgi:hypothetical protein